jgi:hypothetical protein
MATKGANHTQRNKKDNQDADKPKCLIVAEKGIKDSQDFTNFFSSLITDLAEKTVVPNVANAMCNAGGKLIKMVEMEIRYGQHVPGRGRKLLVVSVGTESISEPNAKGMIEAGAKA